MAPAAIGYDVSAAIVRRSIMNDNCQDLECLAGVRMVDFTQFEAGPSCTEALAWLGAEVVKIENPKTGDPVRRVLPGKAPDDPWYFHMLNANKKSLTVDLKSLRVLALVKVMLKNQSGTAAAVPPGGRETGDAAMLIGALEAVAVSFVVTSRAR